MEKSLRWRCPVYSVAVTVLIMAVVHHVAVPNPNMILVTAVIFFTLIGGFPCGVSSAVLAISYSLLFFSIPGQPFHYSEDNLYKIVVVATFIPIQVVLVGVLKKSMDIKSEKLEQVNQRLEYLSRMDYLTDLPNRRYFNETADEVYEKAQADSLPICCALIDIDFFKQYNDYYGHIAGDECLKKIAWAIRDQLHGTGFFAARFGGEEFVILFPETALPEAWKMCRKVQAAIEKLQIPHAKSSVAPYVTVSIGIVSMTPDQHSTGTELIQKADQALYLAKETGRNRIESLSDEQAAP